MIEVVLIGGPRHGTRMMIDGDTLHAPPLLTFPEHVGHALLGEVLDVDYRRAELADTPGAIAYVRQDPDP